MKFFLIQIFEPFFNSFIENSVMDVKKYIGINPQLYVIILKELGNKRFSNVRTFFIIHFTN